MPVTAVVGGHWGDEGKGKVINLLARDADLVIRGHGGANAGHTVVNEQGRAEESSIRFLRSDNQLFEEAVRDALPRMRFIPAEAGGKKVRQLVQMPFVFTLAR